MSIYGRFFGTNQLEEAVTLFLKEWIPEYLSEVERQNGLEVGFYARPKHFNLAFDVDKWPEEQLPIVTVVSSGPVEAPQQEDNGAYSVWYGFQVAVLFRANDRMGVHRGVGIWNKVIAGAIAQHASLGGIADATDWIDEGEDAFISENNRTIGVAMTEFHTRISNVIESRKGPVAPSVDPTNPPSPYPAVDSAEVEIESIPNA